MSFAGLGSWGTVTPRGHRLAARVLQPGARIALPNMRYAARRRSPFSGLESGSALLLPRRNHPDEPLPGCVAAATKTSMMDTGR
jgi:hypothetical protein